MSILFYSTIKGGFVSFREYFKTTKKITKKEDVPQQISATSSNLFKDSHAVRFTHLAFSADGYHVLNGGMSGSIDRSRMFTIITLCA